MTSQKLKYSHIFVTKNVHFIVIDTSHSGEKLDFSLIKKKFMTKLYGNALFKKYFMPIFYVFNLNCVSLEAVITTLQLKIIIYLI